MTVLSKYVSHIVGWQCRVLVEGTDLRRLDNFAQIWGTDGPYCDIKCVRGDKRIRFFYEKNSMLLIILRG